MTVTMEQMEAKFAELRAEMLGMFAPARVQSEVQRLRGWRRKVEADGSFGRVFNGPQWLDRVAIRDGSVNANKLAATLVISNTFTTAEAPADRVQMSGDGIEGFGTIGGTPDTKWMGLSKDGFQLGAGTSNVLSYDPDTGIWEVPQVFTQGLTISDVAGGRLGGTYYTSVAANTFPRMQLSTSGIQAWNSGGMQTFNLNADVGDLTITGTFLLQSATSGSRVDIRSTGIRWYNGATVRAQILNDGSGFLGSTTGLPSNAAVSWGTNGQAIINATDITTGFMNGQRLSDGTVADSKVAAVSANKITAGTGIINALTVRNTLTLGSGGRIQDADGSYWDQTGIVLNSGGGYGDTVQWQTGGTMRGFITSDVSGLMVASYSGSQPGGSLVLRAGSVSLGFDGLSYNMLTSKIILDNVTGQTDIYSKGLLPAPGLSIKATGHTHLAGRLYPGESAQQTTAYFKSPGGFLDAHLGDASGTNQFRVFDSNNQQVFGVNSQGILGLIDGTLSGTPGNLVVKVPVSNRGGTKYLYLYDS